MEGTQRARRSRPLPGSRSGSGTNPNPNPATSQTISSRRKTNTLPKLVYVSGYR